MNRQQRKLSQLISSILIVLITLVLKLLGVNWINAIAIGLTVSIAVLILTSSLSQRIQNFSTWIAYILLGLSIFLLAVFGFPQIQEKFKTPNLIYGYVGGERYDLLVRNETVRELLEQQNLQITEGSITKKGSISQLSTLQSQTDLDQLDFIWTGDAPIAEGGKQILEAKGIKILDNEATFSDPMVLVVNKNAAQTLAENQFFTAIKADNSLKKYGFDYKVDTVTFADFLEGNLTWNQMGLMQYVSPPGVIITDARKSNGGVMAETLIGTIWYNMLLNNLANQPQLINRSDIPQFEPLPIETPPELAKKMEKLRLRSGFAESTSSKIKVALEEGGFPWALTYYSVGKKIIEANSQFTLVALSHTVVNSNQFFSFSEKGTQLLRIIQSPEFQKIAQDYGYNSPQGTWIVLPDPSFAAVKSLSNLLQENQ
ncbi:unknown [Crocosphaera subtropica ATCC 51142]|uniref:Uncharacterized protein n=1 Tax=Crocosphaera subtropica (strain ATCC 51142 / BH68) TaxID=43989 RepID=B1X315_CROS5|nr:hypothetical protein [Crocosphaera subtropica]ACB54526.1 unknown [Crocosphaera subtropica ATCC 51142]